MCMRGWVDDSTGCMRVRGCVDDGKGTCNDVAKSMDSGVHERVG